MYTFYLITMGFNFKVSTLLNNFGQLCIFFLTNAVDSLIFSGNQYICCFEGYNFLFKQVNNHISSTTIKTGNCISNFHSEDLFYQHVFDKVNDMYDEC